MRALRSWENQGNTAVQKRAPLHYKSRMKLSGNDVDDNDDNDDDDDDDDEGDELSWRALRSRERHKRGKDGCVGRNKRCFESLLR